MAKKMPPQLKTGPWTAADLKTLKKLFGNNPTSFVAATLNRPVEATKKKASRMGLFKTKKYVQRTLHRSL